MELAKDIRILIGGAPTTGKSTMARLLAEHLSIPWISSDQIREIMRTTARREDFPNLFLPEGYEAAEKFLAEFSPQEISDKEFDQAPDVWPGIVQLVENEYTWGRAFIVEGVNIVPSLVKNSFGNNQNVKSVFLVDEDQDRIRDVVFNRGLFADAREYSDNFKEKEVEWVSIFSHRLKREAEEQGYPIVEVSKQKDDLNSVLKVLGLDN